MHVVVRMKCKDFAAAAAAAEKVRRNFEPFWFLWTWPSVVSPENFTFSWKFPKISDQFLWKISINFCLHIFVVKYYTWPVLPGDIPGDQIWTSYICTSRLCNVQATDVICVYRRSALLFPSTQKSRRSLMLSCWTRKVTSVLSCFMAMPSLFVTPLQCLRHCCCW